MDTSHLPEGLKTIIEIERAVSEAVESAPVTNYFVVPAPGYYADKARVLSAHADLKAARRAAREAPGLMVRVGAMERGERWLRAYEEIYPEAR